MNNLAIYVLWEKNGLVRDYVVQYLTGLQAVAAKVVVVVNGLLSEAGRERLQALGVSILVRENEGVDFWAYKAGMEAEASLTAYDHVILTNCTCYGPLYPFPEMFAAMASRPCDFWGIIDWPKDIGPFPGTWIQSFFYVFTNSMVMSSEWATYWRTLSHVRSREECIAKHEVKFTEYFASRGFQYDTYCKKSDDYRDMTIMAPDKLIIEQRCPVLKRKALSLETIGYHRGGAAKRALDFIERESLYDLNVIYDDLLATQHYINVKDCLQLTYFLPSAAAQGDVDTGARIALCLDILHDDSLVPVISYARSMPEHADIYITTSQAQLLGKISDECERLGLSRARISLVPPKGEAGAFLVGLQDIILSYDFVCVANDRRRTFPRPGIVGKEFARYNLDAMLKSRAYVENLLRLLQDNERLGMIVPIPPVHASFQEVYGDPWGSRNYPQVAAMLQACAIDVPIAKEVAPVFPYGGTFWLRPKCIEKLVQKPWAYDDFPDEPYASDGTVTHALQRAYPFFVQASGYCTATVAPIEEAQQHMTNMSLRYRSALQQVQQLTREKQTVSLKGELKRYLRKHTPTSVKKLYKAFPFKK